MSLPGAWREYQRELNRRDRVISPVELERRQSAIWVVILIAVLFAGVGAWALWTKGIR